MPKHYCNSLMHVGVGQSFIEYTFSWSTCNLPEPTICLRYFTTDLPNLHFFIWAYIFYSLGIYSTDSSILHAWWHFFYIPIYHLNTPIYIHLSYHKIHYLFSFKILGEHCWSQIKIQKTQKNHTWTKKLFCAHPLAGFQPNGSQCEGQCYKNSKH